MGTDDNRSGRIAEILDARRTRPVAVVAYDPAWPAAFEALRARLADALGDIALEIEHVGSTAVPGLAAKPIIDADIVVRSVDDVPAALERLAAIGYEHAGDLGVAGREAVVATHGPETEHVYVNAAGGTELQRHLTFRDALRGDADLAERYAALKRSLAEKYPTDVDGYVDGKMYFIKSVIADARRNTRSRKR